MDFSYMIPAIKIIRANQGARASTFIAVADNDEEKLLKTTLQPFSFYPMLGGLYNRYGLGGGSELNVCVVDSRRKYRSFMRIVEDNKASITTSFPIPAQWKEETPPPLAANKLEFPEWWGLTPRVSAPWTEEEERVLIQEVESRLRMKEICRRHGRAEGGIRSRMSKLLGQGFEYHPEQEQFDLSDPCPVCGKKYFKIDFIK